MLLTSNSAGCFRLLLVMLIASPILARPASSRGLRSAGPPGEGGVTAPSVVERVRSLPILWDHQYRVSAAVRPLPLPFLWIGRSNAGSARMTRRRATDGTEGFELLIGSDPARVPRRINRWGYIVEEVRGSEATVFAFMNQSSQKTLEEAHARSAQEQREGRYLYTLYQARVAGTNAESVVWRTSLARELTFRDLDLALTLTHQPAPDAKVRHLPLPANTHPGFVAALIDLIGRDVKRASRDDEAVRPPLTTTYVHNGSILELKLRDSRLVPTMAIDGRRYQRLLRGQFEGRKLTSGSKAAFEVLYGTEGALAGTPVRLSFRARWWFRLELTLADR